MAEIRRENQLRLVVYPIVFGGFIHPRWLFGMSAINRITCFFSRGFSAQKKKHLRRQGAFSGSSSNIPGSCRAMTEDRTLKNWSLSVGMKRIIVPQTNGEILCIILYIYIYIQYRHIYYYGVDMSWDIVRSFIWTPGLTVWKKVHFRVQLIVLVPWCLHTSPHLWSFAPGMGWAPMAAPHKKSSMEPNGPGQHSDPPKKMWVFSKNSLRKKKTVWISSVGANNLLIQTPRGIPFFFHFFVGSQRIKNTNS